MKVIKTLGVTLKGFEDLTLPDEAAVAATAPAKVQPPLRPQAPIRPVVKPPKVEDPPDTPTEVPAHKSGHTGPVDYFLNIGFVAYGSEYLLMDRQIIKFSDVCQKWQRPDVRFARLTVKMRADELDQMGRLCVDNYNVPALSGFTELDSSSYIAYISPDPPPNGVAGFSGRNYAERPGNLLADDTADLIGRVRYGSFAIAGDPANSSRALWPSFFVGVKPGTPDSIEMFDLDEGKWLWVLDITNNMSPIVAGAPDGVPPDKMDKLAARLFRCYQFAGPIYIGMRNVRKANSLRLTGPLAAADRPEWVTSRIPGNLFYLKMVEHELQVDAWAFPCPREQALVQSYERRVLNAWAGIKINQMLGAPM